MTAYKGLPSRIKRECPTQSLTLATSLGTSDAIADFSAAAGGMLIIPTGSSLTTITFGVSTTGLKADVVPLNDSAGDPVTLTVEAASAVPIPDECYAAMFLHFSGNAAGAATLLMKS